MNTVTGVVQRMNSRPANGSVAYSLNVNGEWFSAGFQKPPCQEGDTVDFSWQANGNFKNIVKGSIKTIAAQVGTASGNSASSAGARPAVNTRDISIAYQSSRKDAIAVVTAVLQAGVLPVPADKKKAHGAVLAHIHELTNQYFSELQQVVEDGGIEEVQQAPNPEEF